MDQRGQRLIDQQADHYGKHLLYKGKGHIKDQQAAEQISVLDRRTDGLIHRDDCLPGHKGRVEGINNEIVGQHTEKGGQDSACQSSDNCALFALIALVDESGRRHEEGAQEEIGKLPDPACRSANKVEEVLDQRDRDAVQRSHGEGTDQGWKIRQIHLDKGRHEGNGKIELHQHDGHRRKHGGDGEIAGSPLCL